jgi:DNA-binding transcriptional LysR family regulator
MTLEQLRIFIAVAEREHVTKAAQALNLTQPAISSAIAQLESFYRVKLFDRIGRGVQLTETGRLFLNEAHAVIASVETAQRALTDLAGMKRGCITVAASQTVANYWLPSLLHNYRTKFPAISVNVLFGNTEQVADFVRCGSACLGVIEGQIKDPSLAIRPFAEDEMMLVVGNCHKWAMRKAAIQPAELANVRWVLRERGSGTRTIFEETLRKAAIVFSDIDVAFELPSNEAIRVAVEVGAGATVMSRLVADSALANGTLVKLDYPLSPRKFSIIKHSQRFITRAHREFELLVEQFAYLKADKYVQS